MFFSLPHASRKLLQPRGISTPAGIEHFRFHVHSRDAKFARRKRVLLRATLLNPLTRFSRDNRSPSAPRASASALAMRFVHTRQPNPLNIPWAREIRSRNALAKGDPFICEQNSQKPALPFDRAPVHLFTPGRDSVSFNSFSSQLYENSKASASTCKLRIYNVSYKASFYF